MSKYDKYKESAFTHEEMQPMIIETDMTDIVERLRIGRETCGVDMCRIREARSGCTCAEAADEIERLRECCTYFYEALHDIALGAHGNDGVEFARKAIGFVKLEFDADKIAAANDLINRTALREKE
jgi:hypothetical protein